MAHPCVTEAQVGAFAEQSQHTPTDFLNLSTSSSIFSHPHASQSLPLQPRT
eukprot:TRINITY_DN5951_c1_g1_i1.p1 TRINITY_DN5951_c1_g1~~TRINITY_DN5951_c1_g1_i1.p1  ORF type:complete len:51 (-),score=3.19 TRINITY_DN5951_c1_g1_i1:135-287(-)